MSDLRIAYIVNHVAFFVSHRLSLAVGAKHAGFEVALFTGQAGSDLMEDAAMTQLAAAGVAHKRAAFRSSGMNPFVELVGVFQLIWFLIQFKPDIVHCASPKGVLYGGIAARLCRVQGLVLAISGMGYAYTQDTSPSLMRKTIKSIYGALAQFSFHHKNVRVIVQNNDDYQLVQSWAKVNESRLTLIPGSGVDLSHFTGCDAASKSHMVLLPARMLKDKGVGEFVAAARKVKLMEPSWRFVLAGAAGYDNPSAISEDDLLAWQAEGVVEWLGHVEDMVPLYREAAVVCLPSYREGMPKALLEAAAASCAVITTDVTGCREAIDLGLTGDLVPVRDADALAEALLSLIRDDARRLSYGEKGRQRAVDRFSVESVVQQTVEIYRELLNA